MGPYSNLFYWAHARAVKDSTIGLHPHQGFEICSFVLQGEIRHYDTNMKEWRPLQAGGVQIIRAGNGISHSEWMGKDAEMFQIWFDPNLQKTIAQPASYDDYKATDFPINTQNGTQITTLAGVGSPFQMDMKVTVATYAPSEPVRHTKKQLPWPTENPSRSTES